MTAPTFTISLPTADRRRAMAFYCDGLGLTPVGTPAEDGVPEPLTFRLGSGSLVLVPTDGFGWVVGGRTVAGPGVCECLLGLTVATEGELVTIVDRVRSAGGEVVREPEHLPWGFSATWADPDGHLWEVTTPG